MTTYTLVHNGVVIPGQTDLTSYSEQAAPGELGQLIVFTNRLYTDVRFYGIRKVSLPAPPPDVTIEYPVVAGVDIKLWNPVTFLSIDKYVEGGTTMMYFPVKASFEGPQAYRLYRVFE